MRTLGEQLRELRLNARMSQKDLCELTRVHIQKISEYENNKHIPSLPVLLRLMAGLDAWAEVGGDGATLHKSATQENQ